MSAEAAPIAQAAAVKDNQATQAPAAHFGAKLGIATALWYAFATLFIVLNPPASSRNEVWGQAGLLLPAIGTVIYLLVLRQSYGNPQAADSGAVLLELKRSKIALPLCILSLILIFCLDFYELLFPRRPRTENELIWDLVVPLWCWPVAALTFWFGARSARIRLAERGVQVGALLHPWDHIESWRWKDGEGGRLLLILKKGHGELLGRVKIRLFVSEGQRIAVDRILAERLPVMS